MQLVLGSISHIENSKYLVMKYPVLYLWSFCLWKGVAGVWFHWKSNNCHINLCCAADTHLLLSHGDFPSTQCDQAQLCQCPSCWEALLLLMRFGFFFFFSFCWENSLFNGIFFSESYVRFPAHPACPMLSPAEADTRHLLAAMGRGQCWVSKALLPTFVWGQTQSSEGFLFVCVWTWIKLCWQTKVC